MANDYSHMKWIDELVATVKDKSDDREFVSEVLVGAAEHFKTLPPDEKSDIFLFLLGKYVSG